MRAGQLIGLVAAAIVLVPVAARAEPYLMVRTGAKCGDCHTNVTGGGKRTPFAHIHAHDILRDLSLLPIPADVKPFSGELLSPYISIGADLRASYRAVFEDVPDAAGRVPKDRVFRDRLASSGFDLDEATLYFELNLLPDFVTVYVDEDFADLETREAFGLVRGFLPWDTYFKGGRFFPPFGLRVRDDDAFVRTASGYTFQTPDEGFEVGLSPGPFFLVTSVTDGAAGDTDVAVTVNGYGMFEDVPVVRSVLAGASFAQQSPDRLLGSFYAGANWGPLTYLGEFVLIDDQSAALAERRPQYAAYAELDWLLFGWLNVQGTFEFLKVSHDQNQTRYTIGLAPFIDRALQPILQYRINNGPPNDPELNQPVLWLELHVFL